MIQNRLNDKDKDVRGLKKQTSSLLNCAWEKGYVAGFEDGYKSGRQAEERPTGEWVSDVLHNTVCSVCDGIRRDNRVDHVSYCNKCGARMESKE